MGTIPSTKSAKHFYNIQILNLQRNHRMQPQ